MDVKNFIDLHAHIGPEVIPRKYTVDSIVEAEKGRIGGLALKNHFYPTMPLIKGNDPLLIGSVTLNNSVGGLNPDAVFASAKISELPIIVWFPTINAENFLKRSKFEIPPEWTGKGFSSRPSDEVRGISVTDEKGLTEEAKKVLEAIKVNDCILATGHVSWEEARALVKEAVSIGIKRIIVTHPIYQLIGMPVKVQQELAQYEGVYIEQNYAMYAIDGVPLKKIGEQIRAVGPRNCIISSDMGQINSPSPSEGLQKFCELLLDDGITEEELRMMGEINPAELIKAKTI